MTRALLFLVTIAAEPPAYAPADPPPYAAARAADCGCPGECPCHPCRGARPAGPKWVGHADGERAAAAGQPVLVLFTDPLACPACRRPDAGPLADPAVRADLAEFVCVKVDVSTPAGRELAARY